MARIVRLHAEAGRELQRLVVAVALELADRGLGVASEDLEFHPHNDTHLVVANCLAPIQAGCAVINGTLLGTGERTGNAPLEAIEAAAQVAQLVQHYRQSREGGDVPYNFSDAGIIKKLLVTARLREQLIRGQLVIVRSGKHYELVPVTAGERIRSRDPEAIVVWNQPATDQSGEDDPYKDFPIPDDLMW